MKAIFLDIDGVLQPYSAEDHFYEYDKRTRALIAELSSRHNVDFSQYNFIDVLATYYDWNEQAVARLKYILERTGSKIIASTDWRDDKKPYLIRDLLTIHSLNPFWYADNIVLDKHIPFTERRALEIQDSLRRYPIEQFVVLDDKKELRGYFPNNAVITHDYIDLNNTEEAVKILMR